MAHNPLAPMLSTLLGMALAAGLAVASEPQTQAPDAEPQPAQAVEPTEPGQVIRLVGHDLGNPVPRDTRIGRLWVWNRHIVEAPLPEGYPRPTPPGAIELKHYPVVRRAEVTANAELMPELGSNMAFFPLFRHIQRRDIEMTSPVEMDYPAQMFPTLELPEQAEGDTWTMSFLYREVEQGPTGDDPRDQRVTVRDLPPMTMLSIGVTGPYGRSSVEPGFEKLLAWLAENPQWEIAGPVRVFHYNGPSVPNRLKWSEAQIPVRLKDAPQDQAS